MKETQLREVAKCALCGEKIGHAKVPLFWRVRIERWGLKMDALRRQQGLTMFLGGHAVLAGVMGPDEDMAEKIFTTEITVCEICATNERLPVMVMAEKRGSEESEEKSEDEKR